MNNPFQKFATFIYQSKFVFKSYTFYDTRTPHFHDLGKGQKGDHSQIGAKTSYKFAKRLGMSDTDASLISWLVEKHLIMSSISQKKDISDKKTIEDFASEIKVVERLDYLYLLTINDIKSTNPKLWNGWKHQLLRDLYILTRSKLNKEPEKAFYEIAQERKNNVLDKSNTTNENNNKTILMYNCAHLRSIPDICHFFTQAKFLENKIYTEKTRKLRQNTQ